MRYCCAFLGQFFELLLFVCAILHVFYKCIAGSKKKDRDRGDNNGAGAKFLWHHQQCVCVCVGRQKQCRLCAKMDKRVKKKEEEERLSHVYTLL